MKNLRHRVRSVETPRHDPTADQIDNVMNTLAGKNNLKPRDMPLVDEGQALRALIADALKEPCYLDNQTPYSVQIYHVPKGLDQLGQKLILYSLCQDCTMDVSSKGKAELRLIRRLQDENGLPAGWELHH